MKNAFDNGVFLSPSLLVTARKDPMMLESKKKEADPDKDDDSLILEAVATASIQTFRSSAAAAVLEWAAGGDASFASFDSLAWGVAGLDEDEGDEEGAPDLTDDEADDYNDALEIMAEACVTLGAKEDDVADMINDEDDDAAATVMNAISGVSADSEAELIATFSVATDENMFEAMKKVVRGGKVKLIKKRIRPKRMNGAQRQALKKARRKAQTSAAKLHRAKSMKIRRRRFGK
ncbi:MAG TPA: hypothetical protein VGL07_17035 [Buttiauxella sp.]